MSLNRCKSSWYWPSTFRTLSNLKWIHSSFGFLFFVWLCSHGREAGRGLCAQFSLFRSMSSKGERLLEIKWSGILQDCTLLQIIRTKGKLKSIFNRLNTIWFTYPKWRNKQVLCESTHTALRQGLKTLIWTVISINIRFLILILNMAINLVSFHII